MNSSTQRSVMKGETPDLLSTDQQTVVSLTAYALANGKLSVRTSSNHTFSFEEVRSALIGIRDELSRMIDAGPTQCPFRNHRGSQDVR